MREIEKCIQKEWDSSNIFHQNADHINTSKFFASFYDGPQSTFNNNLSYAFHILKAEFATSFHRMKGENSLLPLTVHYSAPSSNATTEKIPTSKAVLDGLKSLGIGIDDRRLISTQYDRYYQSFIRWICEFLKSANKLHYGNRYFSIKSFLTIVKICNIFTKT